MDTEFNLTNPNIYAFIIFGVIIYFIFRILHFVNKKITYKNILKPKIAKSIYILELFTWFLFLFKSIQHFTTKNPLFSYLLIFILAFLLIWTLWYILKDYFAGLYIKICGKYKKDDIISFDTISGKIVKFAERKLIIETNGLQNLEIPYSKLFDKYISISTSVGNFSKADFLIKISNNVDIEEVIEKIKISLIQFPWTNTKFTPSIKIERLEADFVCLRVTASIIDNKYISVLESKIKEKFENN